MALSGFPVRVAIRALELWRAILQQSQLTQAEVEQADSFTGQLQVSIAAASTSADAAEQVHELHQVQLQSAGPLEQMCIACYYFIFYLLIRQFRTVNADQNRQDRTLVRREH